MDELDLAHAEKLRESLATMRAKFGKDRMRWLLIDFENLLSLAVGIVTADYEYRDDAINMLEEFLR